MFCAQGAGEAFGFREQVAVARQAGNAEAGLAGLPCAEQFARAADGEVFFGDAEAVGGFAHDAQAALCGLAQRRLVHQQAVGLGAAPANAAAQLVQLRQAKAFGVLYYHQGRVGDVHADFDDGGGDQQLCLAGDEGAHRRLPLVVIHAAMQQGNADVRQHHLQLCGGCFGVFAFEGVGFFDERADPVGLPSGAAVFADAGDDGVAFLVGDDDGLDGLAPGGQGVDDGAVEFAVVAHRQRSRDGGGGQDELVHASTGRGFVL